MCIIVVKPSGVDFPRQYILEDCFFSNPDGAGFMYNREGGKTVISKGYFSMSDLWDELTKIPDAKSKDVVIHFRISTSGKVNTSNTHPYPVVRDIDALSDIKHVSKTGGFCHNGVLPSKIWSKKELKKYSDTMLFVRDIVSALPQDVALDRTLETIAESTHSRFVLLNGSLKMYGSGWIEDGGCFFSNESYNMLPYYKGYDDGFTSVWGDCPDCYSQNVLDLEESGHYTCQDCGCLWLEGNRKFEILESFAVCVLCDNTVPEKELNDDELCPECIESLQEAL